MSTLRKSRFLCIALLVAIIATSLLPVNSFTAFADEQVASVAELSAGEIKSVSHKFSDGDIIFTVITAPGAYNRIKVTTSDNLKGSLGVANSYTVNSDGDYVWTIKDDAPTQATEYAFDLRSSETGKYLKEYFIYTAELTSTIKAASHEIVDGKIIFTVTTSAGNYSRIKVTTADNLKGSLGVAKTYKVSSNGDYVWTIKVDAPTETTCYAFDLRDGATEKYLKDYFLYEAEIVSTFKSISHSTVDGKIIFTVVTRTGNFDRIKVTTADNLKGSLGVAKTYTINEDGNYVWTVKIAAPEVTTNYAFDLRLAETGGYIKDYGYYECVIEDFIKSVTCEEADDTLVFTVTTRGGDFNRLRCGTSESVSDNIAITNTYKTNSSGHYIWTIKVEKPTETTDFYFDLRDSNTGKFVKEFYIFTYTVELPIEMQMFELVNAEREKLGLPAYIYYTEAQDAADTRAREILEVFSHTRPDGTKWWTVDDIEGKCQAGAENIAKGAYPAEDIVYAFMNSESHRVNILSTQYTHMVVGYYEGAWVQIFVKPR